MNTSLLNADLTNTADVAQLEIAARKAHEQKRTKECLGLISQLLLCDPGNREAQTLRAAVLSEIELDLSDARVLLADSESREDGHKYRKAAEIILLKILYLDPTHSEAKALLAKARGPAERAQPARVFVETAKPKPPLSEELQFTAQSRPVPTKANARGSRAARRLPIFIAGFVLLAGGGLFLYGPNSAATPEAAVDGATRVTPEPWRASSSPISKQNESSEVSPGLPAPRVVLAAAGPTLSPIVAEAPGLLSVSSPTSAEIYLDGKYLGETPANLQLPAGTQTLEYRHGDLRTTLTHDIRSKETTTAVVNFDVTVQINARPWAQVFVDGTVRKPLGQTPLGAIRVPVGSVLAFENPNFPSQSYRVTEKDSSIQVVFP